ncbi:MAG: insulinase family protein [Armatimonadetes bacterium]|nr:insulinase family protein [Armatimonadota bacterium]
MVTSTSDAIRKSRLPSGLTVITERMPQVRTAAMGIWIGTGSRYENPAAAGISHFMEHMLFKGTASRSALDIAQTIDGIGGQINAFTDKEHTTLYVRVMSDHLPVAVEVMSDMLLRSTCDPDAVEKERQVITEEIKTYEDSPDELVQDLFMNTIWNGHPLGRPVLGTAETVGAMRREHLRAYVEERYRSASTIITAAGDVEHDAVVDLLDRYLGQWTGGADPPPFEPPAPQPDLSVRSKETEQVHLCLGVRGLPQGHQDRYVMATLDHVLGGGMSSRLFQEIRERRGLVYTIASYVTAYREGGLFIIYAGMSPEAAPEVLRLTLLELSRIRGEPMPEEEIRRARESLKGSLMLSLESTGSRMSNLARSEIYFGRQISLDEIVAGGEAVEGQAVHRMAAQLLAPQNLAMAAIGPFRNGDAVERQLRGIWEKRFSM